MVFVGNVENADEVLLLTPQGATIHRVLKGHLGNEYLEKNLFRVCAGDPWKPHNSFAWQRA